ncbi:NepR family anti-sigma factor [Erythrobacter sp. WG]|uniref:NepR family anti-sigma factor n=1 Tax=Erythrobacter sp. WG TaxID=2985510 RepID=UPI00226F1DFB|nr:NepR family anti-sigma factor [Erythrobacter sp. WG]MCX9146530.1 NepR family anti-sigma factor [Erythrobacter sp. WG]
MTEKKQPEPKREQPAVAFDPVEAALRQIFDDVAAEDIPDDFADLVAQLTTKSSDEKDK